MSSQGSGSAKKGLGEILVRESVVTISQLEEARREQKNTGGRLSSALVKLGHVNDKKLSEFIAQQFGVADIDIDSFDIPEDAIKAVPVEMCQKHVIIPVSKAGNTLVVAFADPSNVFVKDDVSFVSRCKVEVVVAPESAIQRAIEKYYKKEKEGLGQVVAQMEMADSSVGPQSSATEIGNNAETNTTIKFVNMILNEAIRTKASDIHIEPYEKRLRVRFRIDGLLHEKIQPPPGVAAEIASRIKIMSRLDIAERRRPQDGRIKVRTSGGMDVDLRVSVLPTLFGEKIVMRILDKQNLKLDLTKLGFEEDDLNIFQTRIQDPQGMVLVTGPTGSGKTTTLYSALSTVNDPQINISTAEDPVEFNLDGINQVQVNHEIGFTFAEALRSFLRQDPDVILVGEIRDLDTAEIAFKAANTGHLVLSTLHTNDAPTTVSRLLDMGVQPFLITSTVSLIVAQRLAGRICEKCANPVKVEDDVLIAAGAHPDELHEYNVRKGEGCSICNGSGVKGRVAIYELMQMSTPLREIILKNGSPVEIKRAAIKGGTRTLRQSALRKLKAGLISLEEVLTSTVGDDQV